jgi:adenylate cyclase
MIKELFGNLPLKMDIIIRVTIAAILFIFIIIGYNDYSIRQVTTDSVRALTRKQDEAVMSSLVSFFDTIKSISESLTPIYDRLGTGDTGLERQILNIIKNIDYVSEIHVQEENEPNYFISATQIENDLDRNIFEKSNQKDVIRKTAFFSIKYDKSKNIMVFYDENLKKTGEAPPVQPDILKKSEEYNIWSPVYLKNKNPYMDYTTRIGETNKAAILSISVNLQEVSLLLNQLRVTDRARIFILDESEKIIADSDIIEVDYLKNVDSENNSKLKMALELSKEKKNHNVDQVSCFKVDGDTFLSVVNHIPKHTGLKWKVVTVVSTKDFVESFRKIEKTSFFIYAIILFLVMCFFYFQILKLSEPIVHFSLEANRIKNLELEDPVSVHSKLQEINELSVSMQQLKTSVSNFSKFIPRELVKKFVDSGKEVCIGGEATKITVLFSDIQNFTSIAEKIPPQELTAQLSEYFESLSKVIINNTGTIDKFIGDAIMAFWGAPNPDDKQVFNACRAALVCQQKLKALNKYWVNQNKPPLVTRFGIHHGMAIVGNIGSSQRLNYTALGDTVNLAARIEGINKMYNTNILISETVLRSLPHGFITRPVDVVAVKGKEEGVQLFELMGMDNDSLITPLSEENKKFAHTFTDAFNIYLSGRWKEAESLFCSINDEWLQKTGAEDFLAKKYIARCQDFIKNPPPPNWDGVIHMYEK